MIWRLHRISLHIQNDVANDVVPIIYKYDVANYVTIKYYTIMSYQ